MKKVFSFFTKTAFGLNLMSISVFLIHAWLFYATGNHDMAMFFLIPSVVFSILLPACSTKR